MDLGLRGRVYLVTGGSRGLGFAAAQALVADGARVVLSAPHEATASSAAARVLGRLRVMLAEHSGDKGVRFDSRAWIVTARR